MGNRNIQVIGITAHYENVVSDQERKNQVEINKKLV